MPMISALKTYVPALAWRRLPNRAELATPTPAARVAGAVRRGPQSGERDAGGTGEVCEPCAAEPVAV